MTKAVRLLCLLLVVGCGKVAVMQTEGCKTDADCAFTNLGDDCCSGCRAIAGTKASVDARSRACNGKGSSCPRVDCPASAEVAQCRAGSCVMASAPAR